MGTGGPIFLAGVDRSGIGLLGELLDAHPSIAISRRTNFWSFYHGRFGPLSVGSNLDRCIRSLESYTRIRALAPDFDEIRREFRQADDQSYGRLFALIQTQRLRRVGKSRWGDKSLDAESHASTIFEEYPSARMVHVMRDPRDRFASQSLHRRAGRGGVGSGTALWLWSARLAERNRARYPDRYLVVRFEDLVRNTEECLSSICGFLDEPYCPSMIDVVAGRAAGGAMTMSSPTVPLRRTSIDRYRRDLSARQVAFIEGRAGSTMDGFDYHPSSVLGRFDRCRFVAIDLPAWSAGMALWQFRRRFGGRGGPSRRRTVGDIPPPSVAAPLVGSSKT